MGMTTKDKEENFRGEIPQKVFSCVFYILLTILVHFLYFVYDSSARFCFI